MIHDTCDLHMLDCDLFQCVAARIELFADHPGLQLVRAQTPASGPDNCIVIDAQAGRLFASVQTEVVGRAGLGVRVVIDPRLLPRTSLRI